jgi:hypothetical protein
MKPGFLLLSRLVLVAAIAVAGAGLSLAQGQIYVLESSVASIKVGSSHALDDKITIPAGASIRVVMPSGKTRTIAGPYSGPVADLARGQKLDERVIAWIKNLFQTGGSSERTPGATRGMRPPDPPPTFSWTAVPVSADSTMCAQSGARLQLVRAPSRAADRVTVVDLGTGNKGEAQWKANSTTADWPADLALRTDATYVLLVPGRPQRQVTLRLLERLPGDDDVLAELAARGCRRQFDSWVSEKTAAGKRKAS